MVIFVILTDMFGPCCAATWDFGSIAVQRSAEILAKNGDAVVSFVIAQLVVINLIQSIKDCR